MLGKIVRSTSFRSMNELRKAKTSHANIHTHTRRIFLFTRRLMCCDAMGDEKNRRTRRGNVKYSSSKDNDDDDDGDKNYVWIFGNTIIDFVPCLGTTHRSFDFLFLTSGLCRYGFVYFVTVQILAFLRWITIFYVQQMFLSIRIYFASSLATGELFDLELDCVNGIYVRRDGWRNVQNR